MKIVVIDKGSGYNLFKLYLSIEHGLGNEGMYCVTEGANTKVVDTDKGSGHISIICLSIEHGLGNKGMYYVREYGCESSCY